MGVRAGAEILQVGVIGRDGTSVLRLAPGLLIRLLARLLIGRSLLLLLLRLLLVRLLAASADKGSDRNGGHRGQSHNDDMSERVGSAR